MIDVLDLGHGEFGMPDKKDLPPLFDKSALAFIRRNIQTLVHLVTSCSTSPISRTMWGWSLRRWTRTR